MSYSGERIEPYVYRTPLNGPCQFDIGDLERAFIKSARHYGYSKKQAIQAMVEDGETVPNSYLREDWLRFVHRLEGLGWKPGVPIRVVRGLPLVGPEAVS